MTPREQGRSHQQGRSDRPGCHAGLPAELLALATVAMDRLEPVLDRLRAEPVTAPSDAPCAVCPVCAVIAALRGERPELAVRLAEQAAGLLTALRAVLEDDVSALAPEPGTTPGGRTVQHIHIVRPQQAGSQQAGSQRAGAHP